MILTSLQVPYIHDGVRWQPNPYPLNTVYPNGAVIRVADRRCSFITGDPNAPIPHDAFMTSRLNDADPFQSDRGLLWPEKEYPCITVDYSPTDPTRGADLADYSATWKVVERVGFEFAIWDNDMRGGGGGARSPESSEGRLWPEPGKQKYVLWISATEVDEPINVFPPIILDPDAPMDPPAEDASVPWVPDKPVIEIPLEHPITLISRTEMGTYQGDDGNQYRKVI